MIIGKAKELASALENSAELKAVQETEKVLKANVSAMQLLNDYQLKQQEAYMLQMDGKEPSDSFTDELAEMENSMRENSDIMNYLDAQENFSQILQQVNMIISAAIQGDHGCGDRDCSSGCAGCK